MASTRRDFLKAAVGSPLIVSLSSAVPAFLARSALAARETVPRETALVVVQLSGGNDGLNTVVPYRLDPYAKSRPTLALPPRKLHRIDSMLGFHPRMQGFARLLDDGCLSVVQGVGYPNPSGEHAAAMRIWQTADLAQRHGRTGWLGRAADLAHGTDSAEVTALLAAGIAPPLALNAARTIVPRVSASGGPLFQMAPSRTRDERLQRMQRAAQQPRAGNRLLDFVRLSTLAAHEKSRQLEKVVAAERSGPAVNYPDTRLADSLRTVAQLVRAELGVRIFYTELGGDGFGGFDNHANQQGNHGALLHQLSEAVSAFAADLRRDRLLDRVVLMTFSEFGRTLAENGRRGTGHGSAAPMFLVGGQVRSGLVGPHPSLTDLENGGPKQHTDFRRVYATLLDHWLKLDSRTILGDRFESADVLARKVSS